VNSEGGNYAAGFTIARYHLIGNNLCSVFTDVSDAEYAANPTAIEEATRRYFASVRIRDD
jgi:hypothetical protein